MPKASGESTPSVEELQAELAQARQQAAEYLDGWKRAKADYANLKRETDARVREQWKAAGVSIAMHFADVYQNLQTALVHVPPQQAREPWVEGLRQVAKQFTSVLQELGFTLLTPTAQDRYDITQHEAVERVPSDQPVDTVVETVRCGLRFNGEVVLPARVRVSAGRSDTSPPREEGIDPAKAGHPTSPHKGEEVDRSGQ